MDAKPWRSHSQPSALRRLNATCRPIDDARRHAGASGVGYFLETKKVNELARTKLKGVSTATLASALYKRGLRNQMVQDVRPLAAPKNGSMVGEAFTLRYIPAREDLNPMTVFRDRSHPQRRAVEECPPGCVLVMDSRKGPRAASAGGILATRLFVGGVRGRGQDG